MKNLRTICQSFLFVATIASFVPKDCFAMQEGQPRVVVQVSGPGQAASTPAPQERGKASVLCELQGMKLALEEVGPLTTENAQAWQSQLDALKASAKKAFASDMPGQQTDVQKLEQTIVSSISKKSGRCYSVGYRLTNNKVVKIGKVLLITAGVLGTIVCVSIGAEVAYLVLFKEATSVVLSDLYVLSMIKTALGFVTGNVLPYLITAKNIGYNLGSKLYTVAQGACGFISSYACSGENPGQFKVFVCDTAPGFFSSTWSTVSSFVSSSPGKFVEFFKSLASSEVVKETATECSGYVANYAPGWLTNKLPSVLGGC